MKSFYALEPAEIAATYLRSRGGPQYLPKTAAELVESVRAYLRANRMDHRLDESATIASEAHEISQQIRAQSVPAPSEAEASWQQGYGDHRPDLDDLALANRVAAMPMAEFGAQRSRLGLTKSMYDHLAGI